MIGLKLLGLVLGVASPPLRLNGRAMNAAAVQTQRPPRPPASTQAPVPLVEAPASVGSLQGQDLVQSPNALRGISTSGRLLERPMPLGREEELEVPEADADEVDDDEGQQERDELRRQRKRT